MAKVFTGPRAVVSVATTLPNGDPGPQAVVGLFENCTYGANIGVEPIHILGRFSASEVTPTSYEAIQVNCSGFRVIDQGVHELPKFPKLQDILDLGTITISIRDRQTGKSIMTVVGCVPTSYNSGVQARSTSRISVSYTGLKLTDESGDQTESRESTDLP